jgi:hypothetical protein
MTQGLTLLVLTRIKTGLQQGRDGSEIVRHGCDKMRKEKELTTMRQTSWQGRHDLRAMDEFWL